MNLSLIESKFENFIEWVDQQPDLPKTFDKINLVRYLKASEYEMKTAQKLFRNSLEIRHQNPHIFTQRDPHAKEMQDLIKVVQYVPMPGRTENNHRVTIVRLMDSEPSKIVFNDVIKMFFMIADIRLASIDDFLSDGEVPIWDMGNITIRHFPKLVFSTMRLFLKYTQEAHPVKVRQLHIINCNYLLNRALALVKPFLKPEVAERIHFHTPDSDTLYQYVSRDILPKELGGTDGTMEEYQKYMYQFLDNYRDYLMNDDHWKLNI